jgi:hypothetical protein
MGKAWRLAVARRLSAAAMIDGFHGEAQSRTI